MTGIATTALMAFFVASGVSTSTLSTWTDRGLMPTYPTYQVSMTGYNAVPGQTDADPFTTASGAYSNPDIVAARSRDMAKELPFGTVIEIKAATSTPTCGVKEVENLVGLRVIADTMNARFQKKIDILFDTTDTVKLGGKSINAARVLGACKDVTIQVVGFVDIKKMPKSQLELKLALEKTPAVASK